MMGRAGGLGGRLPADIFLFLKSERREVKGIKRRSRRIGRVS